MPAFASVRHSHLRVAAARVLRRARRKGLTLVTAESCTAGQIAVLLAAQPAAAGVFEGGFVAYSKAGKSALLGVDPKVLKRHTAVSREAACAMALGAQRRGRAGLAVAVTGVAGPSRDQDGNPVGLYFIAVARRNGSPLCEGRKLHGKDPAQNLLRMHEHALALIDRALDTTKAGRH